MNAATVAKINARTEKDNAAFKKLSKAAKRVAIAKDVIKQLNTRKLRAKRGTYMDDRVCDLVREKLYDSVEGGTTGDTVNVTPLIAAVKSCQVCALGATFAVAAGKLDTKVDNSYIDSGDMHKALDQVFSLRQMEDIEDAFEGTYRSEEETVNGYPATSKTALFNKGVRSDKKRMERIMRNIVRNKGLFKP